jgi:ribosome maturation factor RimP
MTEPEIPQIAADDDLPRHEGLEARIANAILPSLRQLGYDLVRVQVSGKEKPVVQIMAERADGEPFLVEDCETISHTIGAVLDVEDPIKAEWMLEVSSAGIDRPLTRIKDWNRYAGHIATVELAVPQDGRKRFKGIALGADADVARLKLEDGSELVLPRGNIRKAKLVLTDELIAATAAPTGSRSAPGAERESDGTTPTGSRSADGAERESDGTTPTGSRSADGAERESDGTTDAKRN